MAVSAALPAYLRDAAAMPFVWGKTDCLMFCANWVVDATGRDPAAHLRGFYHDQRGANRLQSPLGLAGTMRDCARRVGLRRTREPKPGDIAVVRGTVPGTCICAIRVAGGWVVKSESGLARVPEARVMAAWSVPHDA
jgi:hypothetical protein